MSVPYLCIWFENEDLTVSTIESIIDLLLMACSVKGWFHITKTALRINRQLCFCFYLIITAHLILSLRPSPQDYLQHIHYLPLIFGLEFVLNLTTVLIQTEVLILQISPQVDAGYSPSSPTLNLLSALLSILKISRLCYPYCKMRNAIFLAYHYNHFAPLDALVLAIILNLALILDKLCMVSICYFALNACTQIQTPVPISLKL